MNIGKAISFIWVAMLSLLGVMTVAEMVCDPIQKGPDAAHVTGTVTLVKDKGLARHPADEYSTTREYGLYVTFELNGIKYQNVYMSTVERQPGDEEKLLGLEYDLLVDPENPTNMIDEASSVLIPTLLVSVIILVASMLAIRWGSELCPMNMRLPDGEAPTAERVQALINRRPLFRRRMMYVVAAVLLFLGLLNAAVNVIQCSVFHGGIMAAHYALNAVVGLVWAMSSVRDESTQYVEQMTTAVLRNNQEKGLVWELAGGESLQVDPKSPAGYARVQLHTDMDYHLALNRAGNVMWAAQCSIRG